MPRRGEPTWEELRLGTIVTGVLVLIVLGVSLMGSSRGPFRPDTYTLYVYLDDAEGVRVGTPVKVGGVAAGQVVDVNIVPPRPVRPLTSGDTLRAANPAEIDLRDIRVQLDVEEPFQEDVTLGSRAELGTLGLGGERYIKISPGDVRERSIPPGGTIPTVASVDMDLILAKLSRALYEAEEVVSIGNEVQAKLAAGGGTAGRLMDLEGPLYRQIHVLETRSDSLLDLLETGRGLIPGLARDEALAARIDSVRANLAALRAAVDQPEGALHDWADPVELREALSGIRQQTKLLAADLEQGRGTLGRVLNDEELQLQLALLRRRIERLVAAFGEDPLGFVHIQLF